MSPSSQVPDDRLAVDELRSRGNGLGRERMAAIQRARILAGLVEVAGEYGASNITVAHIVARSGVSRRTFYELFVDRDDCFLTAFDETIQRIAAVVVPAYEEPVRWSEKIRSGLSALLGVLDADRAAAQLVIVDALGAGPEVLERRRRVLAHGIAAVEKVQVQAKARNGPPPMAAEGVVGGVLAVLHSRLLASQAPATLLELTGPLMSMIVLPYLGAAAAHKELARPIPEPRAKPRTASPADPLRELEMRLTYRTVRVLTAIASHPGASNRQIGIAAGVQDQGQASKLLTRLRRIGLIHNTGAGSSRGAPNAWTLTDKGIEIEQALGGQSSIQAAL